MMSVLAEWRIAWMLDALGFSARLLNGCAESALSARLATAHRQLPFLLLTTQGSAAFAALGATRLQYLSKTSVVSGGLG